MALSNYTELEYIESTGTQYINTDITPNSNTKIVIDYQLTNTSGSQGLINAYSTWDDGTYLLYTFGALNWTYGRRTAIADMNTSRHILSLYRGVVVYDGNVIANRTTDNYSKVNNPIRLFSAYASGHGSKMRLYSFKIYADNVTTTPLRDFIPVKDFNNVVCLYDKVSGRFFYNEGTGDFVAGPEVITSETLRINMLAIQSDVEELIAYTTGILNHTEIS